MESGNWNNNGIGLLLGIGLVLVAILAGTSGTAAEGLYIIGFFLVLLVGCSLYMIISGTKSDNQTKEEKEKIEFYQECEKNGVKNLKNTHQRQKAILIAQRAGCEYTDIEQYYQEAKNMAIAKKEAEEREQAETEYHKLRDAELRQEKELTRFADYYGRDKRVATLEYNQREYRKKARAMQDSAYGVLRSSQQREMNPGVAGGIASGLFGGVAGVAAYIDAENKNAQIRIQNQKNLNILSSGILRTMDTAHEYEKEADLLQYRIDDAKIKLVSDLPGDKVYMYMSISARKVEISKTGAFAIAADVIVNAKKQKLMIGKSHGVIDGTIIAEMYQDGKVVGSALMMLPTFGVKDRATIGGISIGQADASKPYKIKFKPYQLWIMEE